jgi:hypothetical protein
MHICTSFRWMLASPSITPPPNIEHSPVVPTKNSEPRRVFLLETNSVLVKLHLWRCAQILSIVQETLKPRRLLHFSIRWPSIHNVILLTSLIPPTSAHLEAPKPRTLAWSLKPSECDLPPTATHHRRPGTRASISQIVENSPVHNGPKEFMHTAEGAKAPTRQY